MKWLRQLNCDHEYFKVDEYPMTDWKYGDVFGHYTNHVLYCPKCDKSIELRSGEATRLLKCKEIKKEFNKNGDYL